MAFLSCLTLMCEKYSSSYTHVRTFYLFIFTISNMCLSLFLKLFSFFLSFSASDWIFLSDPSFSYIILFR